MNLLETPSISPQTGDSVRSRNCWFFWAKLQQGKELGRWELNVKLQMDSKREEARSHWSASAEAEVERDVLCCLYR